MCLEDMGHVVAGQSVFFTDHQQFVDVRVSESLVNLAIGYVRETRLLTEQARPPDPLRESPHCRWCSHVSICLPDEVSGRLPARSIAVADPEGEVLHLTTPGSRASLKQGRVIVQRREERLGSLPVDRVVGLVIHGNADVSSALLRELWCRGAAVVWCSFQGRVVAWSESVNAPNGRARIRQNAQSEVGRLDVAREFVSAKIADQATQLRRNASVPVFETVAHLRSIQRMAHAATSNPQLLGIEGRAAQVYFSAFPLMLKGEASWLTAEWPGRQGRNATDPLNALLNYAYGLLLADVIRAVAACGLDPVAGFLHSSSRNKPALALDLMEEFRAPLADSVILGALNNGEVRPTDLTPVLGVARLRDSGRKAVIAAYERRLDQRITHPTFGYRVSWRRVIEVQARLLLATLEGTRDLYVGIRTR